jgi:hypothetical protein
MLQALDGDVRKAVQESIEVEARKLLDAKIANYPENLDGKTLIIEFARGGKDGSSMPLEPPFGYSYSIAHLSPEIMNKATVLYVWVTPEESRRKNEARADPDDPGSILHHGVPLHVMMNDYGCDDMDHLVAQAQKPDTIPIEAHGKHYDLPVGRFDNRVDKTSFIREEPDQWSTEDVNALQTGMREAFDQLAHGTEGR